MMIKLDLLDALSDEELTQVEAYSQALKKRRDEERKDKAMGEAGAILAAAGISLKDLKINGKKGPKKTPVTRRGKKQASIE